MRNYKAKVAVLRLDHTWYEEVVELDRHIVDDLENIVLEDIAVEIVRDKLDQQHIEMAHITTLGVWREE